MEVNMFLLFCSAFMSKVVFDFFPLLFRRLILTLTIHCYSAVRRDGAVRLYLDIVKVCYLKF